MKSKRTYKFQTPELTGPDGTPISVSDALAGRLRVHATNVLSVGETLIKGLHPALSKAIFATVSEIATKPTENASVLSAEGVTLVRKRGRRNSVSVEAQLLTDAALVHNHPEGRPLSSADIQALFDTELASVWAVGGSWLYGATLGKKGKDTSVAASFRVTYNHLSEAAFAVVSDLFRHDLGIEKESLETRHLHAVLSELAEAGFIRYCRIKYGV